MLALINNLTDFKLCIKELWIMTVRAHSLHCNYYPLHNDIINSENKYSEKYTIKTAVYITTL